VLAVPPARFLLDRSAVPIRVFHTFGSGLNGARYQLMPLSSAGLSAARLFRHRLVDHAALPWRGREPDCPRHACERCAADSNIVGAVTACSSRPSPPSRSCPAHPQRKRSRVPKRRRRGAAGSCRVLCRILWSGWGSPRLDSERFRFAPRTCRPICGSVSHAANRAHGAGRRR
jgi:hypothetical protein